MCEMLNLFYKGRCLGLYEGGSAGAGVALGGVDGATLAVAETAFEGPIGGRFRVSINDLA